jgi:hypothetical protein
MKSPFVHLLPYIAILALPSAVIAIEGDAGIAMRSAWAITLDSDGRSHLWDFVSALTLGEEQYILAVEKSATAATCRDVRFRIWQIAKDGAIVSQIDLDADRSTDEATHCLPGSVAGAFRGPGRSLLLVGKVKRESQYSLIKVDLDSQDMSILPLPKSIAGCQFRGVAAERILTGDLGKAGLVVSFELDGSISWSKTYSRGEVDCQITGGAKLGDGSLVLIGQTGTPDRAGLGFTNVWTAKCDDRGSIVDERIFAGRSPRIAGPSSGELVAVCYDGAAGAVTDHRLALLRADLTTVWDQKAEVGPSLWSHSLEIAMLSKERLALVGVVSGNLVVRQVDLQGHTLSIHSGAVKGAIGSPHVAVVDDSLVVGVRTGVRSSGAWIDGGALFRVD